MGKNLSDVFHGWPWGTSCETDERSFIGQTIMAVVVMSRTLAAELYTRNMGAKRQFLQVSCRWDVPTSIGVSVKQQGFFSKDFTRIWATGQSICFG